MLTRILLDAVFNESGALAGQHAAGVVHLLILISMGCGSRQPSSVRGRRDPPETMCDAPDDEDITAREVRPS
jgi:hypothetical protein